LACLRLLSGHGDDARTLIAECLTSETKRSQSFPADPLAHYRKAALHAMLDEKTEALAELRIAVDSGWLDSRATRIDPRFDHIAQTPEFATILAEASRKAETLAQQRTGISSP